MNAVAPPTQDQTAAQPITKKRNTFSIHPRREWSVGHDGELFYAECMRNLCGIYAENPVFPKLASAFCDSSKDRPRSLPGHCKQPEASRSWHLSVWCGRLQVHLYWLRRMGPTVKFSKALTCHFLAPPTWPAYGLRGRVEQ